MSRPHALLLDDPRFDMHVPRAYHPERPERLVAARQAVEDAQLVWSPVRAREATLDELARAHDPRFLEAIHRLRGQSGHVDPDTYVGPESITAAEVAAGGMIEMVDAMLDGSVPRGVALTRPPGHHARPAMAMGFCLINTVAVAAAHAVARGLSRVAVLDWDVHHGNGTEEIFWRRADVLYVSLHEWPFYPGTGAAEDVGEGDGEGFNVNVPLSAGADDGIYRAAFERIVLPILDEYAPELVLVSAGFDASWRDPLGQMELTPEAFGWMGRAVREVADRHAAGRLALVLEGGYDLLALEAGLGRAIAGALGDESPNVERASSSAEIARALGQARRFWRGAA